MKTWAQVGMRPRQEGEEDEAAKCLKDGIGEEEGMAEDWGFAAKFITMEVFLFC